MNSKYNLPFIIFSIIVFSSCVENTIDETGTVNSQDYLMAENIFNDINRLVEDAFIDNGENKSCPKYNIMNVDTSNQDTIIVDFGDGNPDECLSYGKERKGKLIITYTGKFRDSLSVITTTFDQYYVNNNLVQGTSIITNNGKNEIGNINFTLEVISASILGTGKINYNSNKNREWLNGFTTFNDPLDDIYSISGSANGNSTNGQNFNVNITQKLYVDLSCLFENTCAITSGEVELNPNGYSKRIINYGDSICDCNYSVTLNDNEYLLVTD